MTVADIQRHEKQYGLIPPDAVVMIRSDYYKQWHKPDFASRKVFPGVTLDALKFLHLQRGILFHGHEVSPV
jgi:kynurenine formamidase